LLLKWEQAPLLLTPEKEYVICNNIEPPRIEKEEGILEQGYELRTCKWFEEREKELIEELTNGGRVGCDASYPGTEDIAGHINPLRYSLTPLGGVAVQRGGSSCL
jgi:hypothetical protein